MRFSPAGSGIIPARSKLKEFLDFGAKSGLLAQEKALLGEACRVLSAVSIPGPG